MMFRSTVRGPTAAAISPPRAHARAYTAIYMAVYCRFAVELLDLVWLLVWFGVWFALLLGPSPTTADLCFREEWLGSGQHGWPTDCIAHQINRRQPSDTTQGRSHRSPLTLIQPMYTALSKVKSYSLLDHGSLT